MNKTYRELGKQAEEAVRGIKDKDLRREAFRILLLQFISKQGDNGQGKLKSEKTTRRIAGKQGDSLRLGKPVDDMLKRPGRKGGGVATIAVQKLIDSGALKTGRDASGILKELARKRINLAPSQLRMVLLRFSRSGRLKRKIKMKGEKVTYLYSSR